MQLPKTWVHTTGLLVHILDSNSTRSQFTEAFSAADPISAHDGDIFVMSLSKLILLRDLSQVIV